MEEKNQMVIQRIVKAQESRFLILFFSMFVIIFSFLVYHITNLVAPGFLSLVILLYILSVPQTRMSYFIMGDRLLLTSLLGRKDIDIKALEEISIINIPIITFPFLTNGVGYHVGRPKIKETGQVMMIASTFPGKALLLVTGEENIVITPAQPQAVKDILEKKKAESSCEKELTGQALEQAEAEA